MGFEIKLVDLACERDERVLFRGLNGSLESGSVVQIEGPNGSGKTTLLRVLTTLSPDYTGEILWQNQSVSRCRYEFLSQLLYLGHLPGVKKSLTPTENLLWYARITGNASKESVVAALEAVGLLAFDDIPCFQLSAGQQRRVALARLYLADPPPVWVLDEPFTAIDKKGVTQLENTLSRHAEQGGLVVLTTHQDINTPVLHKINLLDYPPGDNP